jgi:MFS family permease
MIKKIGIVLLGIMVANVLIFGVQSIGHKIYPPGIDLSQASPEKIEAYIAGMPIGAMLMVWLAYAVGSIIGGFTVGKLGKQSFGIQGSYWVGGILTVLGLVNLVIIPHPMWFAVLTSVTYLPLCWFGAKSTL